MKILVVGATGGTGRAVVQQAVADGHDVTALVRDPAALLPGAGLSVGDVRDAAAVASALAGVDAVICCLGVRRGEQVATVRSDGTAVLVREMAAQHVERLVAVSSIGVGDSVAHQSKPARTLWPRIVGRERLVEVAQAEAAVRASGLRWTLVRPPRLVDGPRTGAVAVAAGLPTRFGSRISRADLAAVLLGCLTDPSTERVALTAAQA